MLRCQVCKNVLHNTQFHKAGSFINICRDLSLHYRPLNKTPIHHLFIQDDIIHILIKWQLDF